jgi:hypothetical protein
VEISIEQSNVGADEHLSTLCTQARDGLAYARSRHMLLRVVHHVLEIEHNDVCACLCGFFQS